MLARYNDKPERTVPVVLLNDLQVRLSRYEVIEYRALDKLCPRAVSLH